MVVGESIGAYTIVSELGRGGMGVVYLAHHRHLGRKAAIKFLQPEFAQQPETLHRFFTEARAASLINHEGIVRVLDCDVHSTGHPYIVMEYLEGHSLRDYLKWHGRLAVPEAVSILLRVATALAAAHAEGIVHRDLKPDNIHLLPGPPRQVKIVDFGVAKLIHPGADSRTLSGAVVGTPLYMSPEQAVGAGTIDARTDIYALGCILFEMLCGRPPFIQRGARQLMAAHISQMPPAPTAIDGALPPQLSTLVERMLAKAPDDRPGLTTEIIPLLQALGGNDQVVTPAVPTPVDPSDAGTARIPSDKASWSPAPGTLQNAAHATPPVPVPPVVGARKPARARVLAALGGIAVLAVGLYAASRVPRPGSPAPVPAETVQAPAPKPAAQPPVFAPAEPAPPAAAPEPAPDPARAASASTRAPQRRSGARSTPPSTRRAGRVARTSTGQGSLRVSLASTPPGASVCLPGVSQRIGTTNGTVAMKAESGQSVTFLVYLPGFHIERVSASSDGGVPVQRSVRLRPLAEDDLQPPPPCR